ncbi:DUF3575 domain-containing protein [Flavobacterium limnophilum]|uniref:DUF3575 domain-containing protein n=1 Tax=Flavobacterium limnophilum TaxID=3003262 RepID=UPI002482D165|nr:DUF3575 domain-containing protein [Flavobacterium limnophilum]
MKKILIVLCSSIFTFGYSQEEKKVDFKKNEIKGNALFLVAGALEVTYERLLNEESGVGVSLFVPYENEIDVNFSLTPYYRFYFGKKPAAGFFVEGFGMLNSYDDSIYNEANNYSSFNDVTRTDFALGFGLGAKWVTQKGFVFEINGGVGRNLFNSSDSDFEIVGRGGITLGYRF